MKKKAIVNSLIIIFGLMLLFIPSIKRNDEYGRLSLFDFSNIAKMEEIDKTYAIKFAILFSIIYLIFFVILFIAIFVRKQNVYNILSTCGILFLVSFYLYETTYGLNFYATPSWSFYLSLLLLIGWIAYLFSPKWFPRLKKAFAGFRSKHPTKAERIAELEREVNQLKSQDESTDISSTSDSKEKTSD